MNIRHITNLGLLAHKTDIFFQKIINIENVSLEFMSAKRFRNCQFIIIYFMFGIICSVR